MSGRRGRHAQHRCSTIPSRAAGSLGVLLRQAEPPALFYDRAVEDGELLPVDDADLGQDFARDGAQS